MTHQQLLQAIKDGKPIDGLTLDEIVYLRAYTLARIEMEKGQLVHSAHNLYHTGSIDGKTSWMRKLFSTFSYLDYILIFFKAFGAMRAFSRHRR